MRRVITIDIETLPKLKVSASGTLAEPPAPPGEDYLKTALNGDFDHILCGDVSHGGRVIGSYFARLRQADLYIDFPIPGKADQVIEAIFEGLLLGGKLSDPEESRIRRTSMAIDPRKRQKKLAKNRAKRKAKNLANRRAQQERSSFLQRAALGLEFELAARGPIHECHVNERLMTSEYNQGMGTMIVSRLASSGMVAAGVYLLDVFCLGVKDCFARFMTREEFHQLVSQIRLQEPMKKVEPAAAKKLIEDTVAYARSIGFEPHPDFRPARKLLEEIDASACMMEFTFGDRGKPHFISGPHDSPARIRQIGETLERTCGKDNYRITIQLGDPFGGDDFDDDYEEDDDDGD